ncbi:MAG: hypothetical protein H6851_02030 [Geminicoccaceae bacterium]|nr:hypothetical protein [Geminicoccaceae bacterium]
MSLRKAFRQWLKPRTGVTRQAVRVRPAQARPRDFQRSRVYGWERGHVLPLACDPLSLDGCRELVHRVYADREANRRHCRDWTPPEVTDGRGRRHACGSRTVIKLPRWARTPAVVLHECAHGLSHDGHGPGFVRTYVELLVDFAGFERAYLERTLTVAGVRCDAVSDGSATAPPATFT